MICDKCQAEIDVANTKKITNAMNVYVSAATGKVDGAYNSEEKTITIKGQKLVRQDLFKAQVKEVEKAPIIPQQKTTPQSVVSAPNVPYKATATPVIVEPAKELIVEPAK